MRYSLLSLLAAALVACSPTADAPTAPVAPPVVQTPNATLVQGQTPDVLSAEVVGHKQGLKVVRVVFQDNAIGEARTAAGYSDADGTWLFSTMSASAELYDPEHTGTGLRSVELYAPKDAAFVQLIATWADDPTKPDQVTSTTVYSAPVAIAK